MAERCRQCYFRHLSIHANSLDRRSVHYMLLLCIGSKTILRIKHQGTKVTTIIANMMLELPTTASKWSSIYILTGC